MHSTVAQAWFWTLATPLMSAAAECGSPARRTHLIPRLIVSGVARRRVGLQEASLPSDGITTGGFLLWRVVEHRRFKSDKKSSSVKKSNSRKWLGAPGGKPARGK